MNTDVQNAATPPPGAAPQAPSALATIPQPVPINEILCAEFSALGRTTLPSPPPPIRELYRELGQLPDDQALSALCFSGGGIRSATFNLGVIQALAKRGLLGSFDYLSTVSGGGYVGAWLQGWIQRSSIDAVTAALATPTAAPDFRPLAPEPKPLDHLREYSNYLTPRVGLFSTDTWAAAAMIIRNLILNWLVLLPVLAVLIAIPQSALIVATANRWDPQWGTSALLPAFVVEILASVAVYHFRRELPPRAREGAILVLAVIPIWLAAMLLTLAGLWLRPEQDPSGLALFCAVWSIGVPLAGWVLALISTGRNPAAVTWRSDAIGIVLSGLVASALLYVVARYLLADLRDAPALFVILSVPILLGIYLLARTLYVAFASIGESRARKQPTQPSPAAWAEADREWWARLSGWVLIMIVVWIGTSTLIVLGYYFVDHLVGRIAAAMGGATGLLVALLGAAPVSSRKPAGAEDGAKPSPIKNFLLMLLAPVTVASIILALAQFNAWAGQLSTGIPHLLRVHGAEAHLQIPDMTSVTEVVLRFLAVPLGLLLIAWLLGWVVNVNRFSAHGLYRNRLVRAYLGASHPDRDADTDPFTGFSVKDDIPLHELRKDGSTRLFPVINVALNLVRSAEHLAWQQRKAESFSMTPLYCGNFYEGYRKSRDYGGANGVSLGTAITISGAAANPSAGYHSSPLVSFLMTLFNVRLGCWLGNPNTHGEHVYRYSGPRHAWKPLFGDLLGLTDSDHAYVNLSDGGHFDNLGVYEMVLRRCRFIVASDAGQDPRFGFEDLGNLIRKVRIDFGVPIEFAAPIRIRSRSDTGADSSHDLICALATVHYEVVDAGARPGVLLYLKPTLHSGNAPVPYDIFSYARSSSLFPHESTADQWFTEAQFESYRALGEHLVETLAAQVDPTRAISDLPALFEAIGLSLKAAANASTTASASD